MVAEQHVAVSGNVIEPVIELVCRSLAHRIEREDFVGDKKRVEAVGDGIDADGRCDDPDGVDGPAAVEGDVGERQGPASDSAAQPAWLVRLLMWFSR